MKTFTETAAVDLESLVAEVADRFTDDVKQGRSPSVEKYAQRHPEIAHIIRQVFPALALLDSSMPASSIDGETATAGFSSSAEADEQVTGVLGDFRILRELGRGGMGVVYEAEQISLGRRVALKVLPFAAMLDKQQLARFKNEARAAATLDHPNIVAVYSVGLERGVHYYAMQLVDGQSLAEIIAELKTDRSPSNGNTDLPAVPHHETAAGDTVRAALSTLRSSSGAAHFQTIARLGVQAAEALDHAHQSGILHRDIKPANLMVDDDGKLWVTDFGLARIEADAGMTMTGDILGTLRYMSPEQALAKRVVVDHRSDVYSLGITLYELLTLRPAFAGDDRQELLRQIAFEEPRRPRHVNARIPQDLETIVLNAIEKNPADRYATAKELAEDLRRFLDDRPISAKPPTLLAVARKWSRRHRPFVASAAVSIALMLITSIGVLAWSNAAITRERNAKAAALQEKAATIDQMNESYRTLVQIIGAVYSNAGEQIRTDPNMRYLHDEIIRQQTALLEKDLNEPSRWYSRGAVYHQMGEPGKAVDDLTKAIDLNPNFVVAWAVRAKAYFLLNQDAKAVEGFTKVIALASKREDLTDAYLERGQIYVFMKRFKEAISDLDKTIELTPDDWAAWAWRGRAHFGKSEYENAERDFTKALELMRDAPGRAEFLRHRAEARAELKRYSAALEDFDEALALYPNYPELLRDIGWYWAVHPDAEVRHGTRAVELATKACELTKNEDHMCLAVLAAAYAETGDYPAAVAWMKKAIDRCGDAGQRELYSRTLLKNFMAGQPWRTHADFDPND